MRLLKIAGQLVLALILLTGCGESTERQGSEETEQKAESGIENFEEKRSEFISETNARMDSLDEAIKGAGQVIQQKGDDTRDELQQRWSELKKNAETTRSNLENMKKATEENWNNLKNTINDQIKFLRDQLNKLKEDSQS